jgi:hypothetical protein
MRDSGSLRHFGSPPDGTPISNGRVNCSVATGAIQA